MLQKSILIALASAALIPAAAYAHPGGGGGGPGMGGMGNAGGFGNMGGFGNTDMGSTMRDEGRLNSQGPEHASVNGIDHANQNSVLFGTSTAKTVTSGALAGLKTGTTLLSNGTAVGTVAQIRTNGQGTPVVVVIKGTNGGFYAVPVNKLTFSGGTLSTTAKLAGINDSASETAAARNASGQGRLNSQGAAHASATGIAHANQNSVLANATTSNSTSSQARLNSQGPLHASATGIAHANQHSILASAATGTRLSGVTVGMPLFENGVQIGIVSRVVTANGVIERVLVQGTNGRTYSLSPSALVAANGSLTTSAKLHGI